MSKTFGCRHRLSLRQVRVITEHPISSKVQEQECVPHVPKVLSHFHNHMANKHSQLRGQSQFLPSNDSDCCGGNTREKQLSSCPHNHGLTFQTFTLHSVMHVTGPLPLAHGGLHLSTTHRQTVQ